MVVKTPNKSKMAHIVENRNYQIVIKPSCYKQKPPNNPNIPHKRLTAHTQPPSHNRSPSALSYVSAKELVSPSTPQTLGKRSHKDASGGVRPPPSDFHSLKRLTGTTYYPQTPSRNIPPLAPIQFNVVDPYSPDQEMDEYEDADADTFADPAADPASDEDTFFNHPDNSDWAEHDHHFDRRGQVQYLLGELRRELVDDAQKEECLNFIVDDPLIKDNFLKFSNFFPSAPHSTQLTPIVTGITNI